MHLVFLLKGFSSSHLEQLELAGLSTEERAKAIQQSEEKKATRKAYSQTEQRKAQKQAYEQSEKGKTNNKKRSHTHSEAAREERLLLDQTSASLLRLMSIADIWDTSRTAAEEVEKAELSLDIVLACTRLADACWNANVERQRGDGEQAEHVGAHSSAMRICVMSRMHPKISSRNGHLKRHQCDSYDCNLPTESDRK